MKTAIAINRPDASEYAPYYERYVSLVAGADVLAALGAQLEETLALLAGIPESRAGERYAADKWSIKEVVGHMNDVERILGYRALRIARADTTPLPGFEQDDYVRNATFDDYPLAELAAEFDHIRRANILLFRHLSGEAWGRRGRANDNEVSVRALAYIIAGHELHHGEVLRTKYLRPDS